MSTVMTGTEAINVLYMTWQKNVLGKLYISNLRVHFSIKENITNIFGAKQMQTLIEFKQCLPSEEVCNELNIKRPNENSQVFR